MARHLIGARPIGPEDREIYAIAGASNGSGRGLLTDLTGTEFPNASRVKNFNNAWQLVPGVEPIDDATGQLDSISADATAGVGPGMAFGSTLAGLRRGKQIVLVPCAVGSSTVGNWAAGNLSRTTMYGSMIARLKAAVALGGTIKGAIWYLGGNDCDTSAHVTAWPAAFNAILSAMRTDLGIADLPMVMSVLCDDNPSDPLLTNWQAMQTNQAAMTGSNFAVVDARGLPRKPDDLVHLSTAGQLANGAQYATAMQGLL
jgi:hypothetical protein